MTLLAWRLFRRFGAIGRSSLIVAVLAASVPSALAQQLPQSSAPPAPDANAPNTKEHHGQMSTKDVKEKLQKAVDSKNAAYAGSDIKVAVDDQNVTLTGTVQSSMQIEMAKQLAEAYAGNRKVVSQLAIH